MQLIKEFIKETGIIAHNHFRMLTQIAVITLIFGGLCMGIFIRPGTNCAQYGRTLFVAGFGLIVFSLILICLLYKNRYWGRSIKLTRIKHYWKIILFIGICIWIALIYSGNEPRWDGAYLYHYIYGIYAQGFQGLFQGVQALQFCGHLSMAYVLINVLFGLLFGDLYVAMTFINICLYAISIFCVYAMVQNLKPGKNEWIYIGLTAIYAFSPMVLGLVNYNYWDYWTIVIWPIILYTAMKREWFYHYLLVLTYAFWCLGTLIFDTRWKNRADIKKIFKDKVYIFMGFIGIFWLYTWLHLPHWNGNGGFIVDKNYIIEKIQVFFVFNFNWLLTIFALIAMVQLCRKKYALLRRLVFPVVISDIAVVIFNCLFRTVNHPRYMDSHVSVLSLLAIVGGLLTFEKVLLIVFSIVMSVVVFMANYFTYDVISLHIFQTINVGSKLIDAAGEGMSDSIVYNQQYRYLDKAINLALEDIVEEPDVTIYFPLVGNNPWYMDGISAYFKETDEIIVLPEFWDKKKKIRTYYETNDTVAVNIVQLPDIDLPKRSLSEHGCYFYFPYSGEQIASQIKLEYENYLQEEFSYRGVTITRIKW